MQEHSFKSSGYFLQLPVLRSLARPSTTSRWSKKLWPTFPVWTWATPWPRISTSTFASTASSSSRSRRRSRTTGSFSRHFFGSVTSYQLLQKGEWPFNQLKFLFTLFWNEVVNVNKVIQAIDGLNCWLLCLETMLRNYFHLCGNNFIE